MALVVEDEACIAKLLFEILHKRLGYETEIACDGEEAIRKLSQRDFDVIILDIRLPMISGKDLFRILEGMDPELPRRVIFCTGDLLNLDTRAFLDKNKNLFLIKPFSLRDVEFVLDDFFCRRERPSEPPAP